MIDIEQLYIFNRPSKIQPPCYKNLNTFPVKYHKISKNFNDSINVDEIKNRISKRTHQQLINDKLITL